MRVSNRIGRLGGSRMGGSVGLEGLRCKVGVPSRDRGFGALDGCSQKDWQCGGDRMGFLNGNWDARMGSQPKLEKWRCRMGIPNRAGGLGVQDGGTNGGCLWGSGRVGGWRDRWMERRMDAGGGKAGAVPVSVSSGSGSQLQTAEQETPKSSPRPPALHPLPYQRRPRRSLIQTNCGADVGK